MKKILSILLLGFLGCSNSFQPAKEGIYAVINTNKGTIIVELFYKKAPLTVANFIALSEGIKPEAKGKKFYDGLKFHRVVKDFMVQTGCPKGDGTGDPGYKFPDEFVADLKHDSPGILSMANSGPNTNGSQIFITHRETPWLDGKHTVFGKVIDDKQMEIVNKIEQGDVIKNIMIVRKGKEANDFDANVIFDKILVEKQKEESEKISQFVSKMNAFKEKGIKLKSGLVIYTKEKGKGKKPKKGQVIQAHYTGMLENGKIFDTSVEDIAKQAYIFNPQRPYNPIDFSVGAGQVILGWDEGFMNINEGTKAILFIPSDLAYGQREIPGVIPANSNLIFEVELVKIKK